MRIAILDPCSEARTQLKELLLKIEENIEIAEYGSVKEALEGLKHQNAHVVLLETDLGGESGIETAKEIRSSFPDTIIAFVTDDPDLALDAFHLGADGYLLKPAPKDQLERIFEKYASQVTPERYHLPDGKISVTNANKISILNIKDILFIETGDRGSLLYTPDGVYFERTPIGDYERKLSGCNFIRIHKSVIVNIDAITEMFQWSHGNYMVKVHHYPNMLPVSRKKIKELKSILTER